MLSPPKPVPTLALSFARGRFAPCWVLALAACANTSPRTQVMLEVDAEAGVRAETARLRVEVYGGPADAAPESYEKRLDQPFDTKGPVRFPRRVALVPLTQRSERAWTLQVSAERTDGTLAGQLRARGGYAKERTVLLRVVFTDNCLDRLCDNPSLHCRQGQCVDATVNVANLPNLE